MSLTVIVAEKPTHADLIVSQYLDSAGDGSGTINMNGTYTSGTTNGVFYYTPPTGFNASIARIIFLIEDAAVASGKYGGIAALTNGVTLSVTTGGPTGSVSLNLTPTAMKTNSDWTSVMHDVQEHQYGGGGTSEYISGRMTFRKFGTDLHLRGDESECLRILCQDTLAGLITHTWFVQGTLVRNTA